VFPPYLFPLSCGERTEEKIEPLSLCGRVG
jgi:hypothetical protein